MRDRAIQNRGNHGEEFHDLAHRWGPRIDALAARFLGDHEEARDVRQSVLMRVWSQRDRPAPDRFSTWIHRVVVNACQDRLRSRKARPTLKAFGSEPVAMGPRVDESLADDEAARKVADAVAALPSEERRPAPPTISRSTSTAGSRRRRSIPDGMPAPARDVTIRVGAVALSASSSRHNESSENREPNDPRSVVGRRALLLDLDGTLYPAAAHGDYLDEVSRITGLRVQEIYDAADGVEAYTRLREDRARHGFRSDTETLATLHGIRMPEMNRFRERNTRPERFLSRDERIVEAIERLVGTRILVLGTNNTPGLARTILRVLGIDEAWFAGIFSSEDLGVPKPDVGFFRELCARTGLQPADLVSVGDRPASDLEPAASLGMATWLVSRVEDLEELAAACEAGSPPRESGSS